MEENRIGSRVKKYFSFSESTIKISELCFLAYWSLMLFAKAIGWYDGQTVYKVILVVSIAFWVVKMVLTKYSLLEYGVVLVLLGLSGAIYLVSGEKGIVICMMTMLGVKNLDIKRVMKVGITVWGGTFGVKFVYNLIFLQNVQTAIQQKNVLGYVTRYFMGYSHPNVLHISFFMLTTLIICYLKEKLTLRISLWLMAFNVLLFLYSFSVTGFGITSIYIVLSYYVHNRKLKKWQQVAAQCLFPIILGFSIVLPIILSGDVFEKADRLFNNRFAFANMYLKPANLKIFGNNLALITDSVNTMDNSYVFTLIIYGVPLFLLVCGGYILLIRKQCKNQENIELVTTLCLLLGGITEPYLLNTSFKNISLLFLGVFLFDGIQKNSHEELRTLSKYDREITIKYPSVSINLSDEKANLKLKWAASISVALTVVFIVVYLIVDPPKIKEGYGYILYADFIRNTVTFLFGSVVVSSIALSFVFEKKCSK